MADGEVVIDTSLDPSGFEKGLSKLGSLASTGLKATTTAISAVSTALSACAAYCVKVGSDFEAGMSNVEAISGASAQTVTTSTGKMVDGLTALTEKAKEMGATTKFSATESSEALNYMAMAGWGAQDMYDGLAGIMTLAAASGENLATTSDIVTDALTAFKMEAGDAGHFADVLAQVSASANTNVGLLGETFKYVAPLCGTMGYSAEDAAVAIGLMANSGIKGSQAGNSLRAAIANMAAPTNTMAEKMAALGIEITNSDGSSKSLMEVLLNLRSSFDGLSESEQAAAASTIFGKEAMSGMLAIINAGDEDFAKLTEAIYNCDGAADQMAATMQDNLQGQLTILKSGVEGLGIAVYEKLQEPLKELAVKGQEYISQLTTAFNEGGFNGLVGEIGNVLADVVSEVVAYAPKIIDAAVSVIDSFISGIRDAIPTLAASTVEIGATLIDGILTIVPEFLTAGLELITALAEGLASAAPGLIEEFLQLLENLTASITEHAPDLLQAGISLIQSLASGITSNIPTITEQGISIIGALFDAVMEGLPQLTEIGVGLIDSLSEGIQNGLPSLIPKAMEALVAFSGSLRENVGLLVDAGLRMIQTLAGALISNIPVFIETVPTIITNLCGCINDNAPKLLSVGLGLIFELAKGLIAAIPTLLKNIPQIIQAVAAVFSSYNWLQLGSQLISAIGKGIQSVSSAIPDIVKNIGTKAKELFESVDWLGLGKNVISFIGNGIKTVASNLPNILKSIGSAGKSLFESVDWLGLGKNVISFIGNGIKSLISEIPNILKSIAKNAMDGFKGLPWASIGKDVISGIANGIANCASILVNTAVNAAKNAINAVKSWLGINSPSKTARDQIGKWILPGVGEGIEESEPELNEKMENAADNMISSFGNHDQNVDVSGLVSKLKAGVDREIGSISTDVTVRTRSGSGQVDHTSDEGFDYERMGDAVAQGFVKADVKVECDDREFGRLVSDHTPD